MEQMVLDFAQSLARSALVHPSLRLSETEASSAPSQEGEEIQRLEQEMIELAEFRGEGKISTEEWWAMREPLQARLTEVKAKVRASVPEQLILDLLDINDNLRNFDIERQRLIVSYLVKKVVIGPAIRGRNFFDPSRVSIVEFSPPRLEKVFAELSE